MPGQIEAIEEYFAAADEREPDLRQLDMIIREAAPELPRRLMDGMSGMMLGYGTYHYRYPSGREGDWVAIGLANQKRFMSLYVMAVHNGQYAAEVYADRLGKVNVGKSCIRFKKLADVDVPALRELLAQVQEWYRAQEIPAQ